MLLKILSLFRSRTICNSLGEPYLTRYKLLWIPILGWKVWLHHIHRSDESSDLHDHPWWFWSIPLTEGGYWEHYGDPYKRERRHCERGRLYWHDRFFRHTIFNIPRNDVWTLVLRGPTVRRWGFWPRCEEHYEWMPWETYCERYDQGAPVCEEEYNGWKRDTDGESAGDRGTD